MTSGDPLAQPVNAYNNIQNGFGIFAGYSASVYRRTKPKPVILSIERAILPYLFITSDARHSRRAIESNTIDGVNIQILQRGENAGRCF
jgi:hypothetical protein